MKRFKILATLLLVSFLVAVFQNTVMSVVEGFNLGYGIATFELDHGLTSESFTYLDLVPKSNDVVLNGDNTKDGSPLSIIPSRATLATFHLENTHEKTITELIVSITNKVLNLAIIVCYFYLLVIFIRIILSFRRSEVFEEINIRRINIIGIGFIVLGFIGTVWQGLNVLMARQAIELADYTITYSKIVDWDAIVMGLVILLMNEVLRIATGFKKEQDLTI